MNILINASNLGTGGATQVTDSLCSSLNRFPQDNFVVVLRPQMKSIAQKIINHSNVTLYEYGFKNTWRSYLLSRDKFLDELVKKESINVVLSVFGPTWWTPRVPHLCGFALAHLIMPESPYFRNKTLCEQLKLKVNNWILTFFYRRCSKYYYTENEMISIRVKDLLHCKRVATVTNYYNQVFDLPENQNILKLPKFNGTTILTISNAYPHKNLPISLDVVQSLRKNHCDFKFRFVFTIDEKEFPTIPEELKNYFLFIGRVDISACPSLYEQSDVVFQPTLLECFTATYPEAMRMRRPIVTTDLAFARGLCGEAAVYYDALSGEAAAEAIYKVATNDKFRSQLIENGTNQLRIFDDYYQRSEKLIDISKQIAEVSNL